MLARLLPPGDSDSETGSSAARRGAAQMNGNQQSTPTYFPGYGKPLPVAVFRNDGYPRTTLRLPNDWLAGFTKSDCHERNLHVARLEA